MNRGFEIRSSQPQRGSKVDFGLLLFYVFQNRYIN